MAAAVEGWPVVLATDWGPRIVYPPKLRREERLEGGRYAAPSRSTLAIALGLGDVA